MRRRSRAALVALGTGLAAAGVGGLLSVREARRPAQIPAVGPGLGSEREPEPRGEAGARAGRSRAASREATLALLATRLAEVLPEERSLPDRKRMAELLLQARDARQADEPAAIAREIQLAVAIEFQRIAGESLGEVLARLSGPEYGAPRPPRVLTESASDP